MSSPQKSLLVSAFTKLDFGSLTRFSENCATDTSIEVESSTVNVLLSIVRITLPSRETVEIFILVFSGTTSGKTRAARPVGDEAERANSSPLLFSGERR